MRIGNVVVYIDNLSRHQGGNLSGAPRIGRIKDNRQPLRIRLYVFGPDDIFTAFETAERIVNSIVDDNENVFPPALQPRGHCRQGTEGIAVGTDMSGQKDRPVRFKNMP